MERVSNAPYGLYKHTAQSDDITAIDAEDVK